MRSEQKGIKRQATAYRLLHYSRWTVFIGAFLFRQNEKWTMTVVCCVLDKHFLTFYTVPYAFVCSRVCAWNERWAFINSGMSEHKWGGNLECLMLWLAGITDRCAKRHTNKLPFRSKEKSVNWNKVDGFSAVAWINIIFEANKQLTERVHIHCCRFFFFLSTLSLSLHSIIESTMSRVRFINKFYAVY